MSILTDFFMKSKKGENVVICKNKRHFLVQRPKIDNPAAIRKYAKKKYFSNIFDVINNLKMTRIN